MLFNINYILMVYNLIICSWGEGNDSVSNHSLKHLSTAFDALEHLNAVSLNIVGWGFNNMSINTTGVDRFLRKMLSLKRYEFIGIDMRL